MQFVDYYNIVILSMVSIVLFRKPPYDYMNLVMFSIRILLKSYFIMAITSFTGMFLYMAFPSELQL